MTKTPLSTDEIERLRRRQYNATLDEVIEPNDELRILRVTPDRGIPEFASGQYVVLGMGNWEPRVEGVQDDHLDLARSRKMTKRAYSISCSILNPTGEVVSAQKLRYLEFYVALVRSAVGHAPVLTPRLFAMTDGARLFVGNRATGNYTLEPVRAGDQVVMLATGTGEAPHNAMIAELLANRHKGRIVAASCVRFHSDLAYLETHRRLESQFANYRYLSLTTRESENLDPEALGFIGKMYLQQYVESGRFERDANLGLDPECTHVFLCGSPAMIGAPSPRSHGPNPLPDRHGMVQVLQRRGFQLDRPRRPGNIHFEKYW